VGKLLLALRSHHPKLGLQKLTESALWLQSVQQVPPKQTCRSALQVTGYAHSVISSQNLGEQNTTRDAM
jgi:hypothetical protein